MVVTGADLWMADDNGFNAADCGKTTAEPSHEHAGICFLPYPTS